MAEQSKHAFEDAKVLNKALNSRALIMAEANVKGMGPAFVFVSFHSSDHVGVHRERTVSFSLFRSRRNLQWKVWAGKHDFSVNRFLSLFVFVVECEVKEMDLAVMSISFS